MRLILITICILAQGCAQDPYRPPPQWQLYTYTRTVDPTTVTVDTKTSTGYPSAHKDNIGYNPYSRSYGFTPK